MRIYLAIPYTRHEKLSFPMANLAASELIKMGYIPFSPISMSHPIVVESKRKGNYKKELLGTWDVWSKIDLSFLDWCDEVWVVNLDPDAVLQSTGVQAEIKYARKIGKKVRTIEVIYDDIYDNKLEHLPDYTFIFPEVTETESEQLLIIMQK